MMSYVVRKTWKDTRTQKGEYDNLADAKKCADANDKYYVYNCSGKKVYPITTNRRKTTKTIAKEVIAGKWGTGDEMKKAIKHAGYDYRAVQVMVDRLIRYKMDWTIHDIAQEVVEGKWGEGEICKHLLEESGYNYKDVLREIERLDK